MGKQISWMMAALLVAGSGVAQAEEWIHQWPLSSNGTVAVTTNDASVEVQSSNGSSVEARIVTRGWAVNESGGSSAVRVSQQGDKDRVSLDVRVPSGNWNWLHGDHSVRIELRVPQRAAVDVRTGDGSIRANGLHGPVRFNTGDGSVHAENLDGKVSIKTGDGSVRVSGRFDAVDLDTSDGSVAMDAERGSKVQSEWRVHTGDGSVAVHLPSELAADLDVHTGDGHIDVDLPLTTQTRESGGNDLRGSLNGGGMKLSIRTGDGSVRVSRL